MSRSYLSLAAVAACLLAPSAWAQDAPVQPVSAAPEAATPAHSSLAAGAIVMVALDDDLTTKTAHVGNRFNVTVTDDVVEQGIVVIPKGTTGFGEVTFVTGKGGFGKQGILGIALRFLDLDGRQVMLDGHYREEGRGNDGAAAATMFAVGIFAIAVQGKGAVIPKGRVLKAHTGEDVTYSMTPPAAIIPASAPADAPAVQAQSTPN